MGASMLLDTVATATGRPVGATCRCRYPDDGGKRQGLEPPSLHVLPVPLRSLEHSVLGAPTWAHVTP